jgi:hypothetical protein
MGKIWWAFKMLLSIFVVTMLILSGAPVDPDRSMRMGICGIALIAVLLGA